MPDIDDAVIKKIMPHSTEAEESVIGGMLIDPASINVVSEIILDGSLFYNRSYGSLYDAMLALNKEGSAVDIEIDSNGLMISNKTNEKYTDVESLKKPFVKGSDSRSDKGTGLGLSIADNNLNILGYKLELVSEEGLFKAKVRF